MTVTAEVLAETGDRRGGRSRPTGPRSYDFRRPNKLSREHARSLQIAYDTFARQFSTVLTTTLRTVTPVTLTTVEQLTYDEYVRSTDDPSFLAVVSLEPLDGLGVLYLPLRTAMLTVDHLLGGNGQGAQPRRPLSDIESTLVRAMVERLLSELAYAFEGLTPLQPHVVQIESNPRFAQVAASSQMMIVAGFEVRLGQDDSVATLCLPFDALEPALERAAAAAAFSPRTNAGGARFTRGLRDRLESVPVEVSVQFHPARLHPAALLDLAVGDVLRLPHRVSDPLPVTTGGSTVAYAVPGAAGRQLACRIVDPPDAAGPRRLPTPEESS